jgi:hypothetical protein
MERKGEEELGVRKKQVKELNKKDRRGIWELNAERRKKDKRK